MVSQELSAALLEEVEGVLQRRPVIWDNLYANDYDCRRVFLGPYTGRAPGLVPRLRGLLLNPNCELQANFIPIHTLGSWLRSELGSCAHPDHAGTWPQRPRQHGTWGPMPAMSFCTQGCPSVPQPCRLFGMAAWVRCLTWLGTTQYPRAWDPSWGHPRGWGGGWLPTLGVAWDHSVKQRVGLPRLVSANSAGTETAAALGDSRGPQEGSYSPQEALELALHDWVAEINRQALEPGR